MKSFFLLATVLAYATAHSYMDIPYGYTNPAANENTTAPCGSAALTSYTSFETGSYMEIHWVYNTHQGDTNPVYINLLNYPTRTFYSSLANYTFTPNDYYIRIDPSLPTGDYLVQWNWLSWWTCAWIRIVPQTRNVTYVDPSSPTATSTLKPSSVDNYEATTRDINNANFMYVDATPAVAGTSITVVTSRTPSRMPNLTSYDDIVTSTDTATIGICPRNINTGNIMEFGVAGDAGASGTVGYTINFHEYNGLVNSGSSLDITAHNGPRYFATASYSTFDQKQLVVLRTTLAHNNPTMLVDTSCSFSTANLITATYPDDYTICAELGTSTANKYVKVGPIETDYTFSTEKGTSCADTAGATAVTVSVLVVFFAALLALLF